MKRHGPAHKERSGGVVLGCSTPDAARAAAERIGLPVLVCEDLRGGADLLCGVVRDAQIGPLVVCGIGGSLAEALGETTVAALAPLDEQRGARTRPLEPSTRSGPSQQGPSCRR